MFCSSFIDWFATSLDMNTSGFTQSAATCVNLGLLKRPNTRAGQPGVGRCFHLKCDCMLLWLNMAQFTQLFWVCHECIKSCGSLSWFDWVWGGAQGCAELWVSGFILGFHRETKRKRKHFIFDSLLRLSVQSLARLICPSLSRSLSPSVCLIELQRGQIHLVYLQKETDIPHSARPPDQSAHGDGLLWYEGSLHIQFLKPKHRVRSCFCPQDGPAVQFLLQSVLFHHVMSRVFVRSVPPRAGVAAIREWGGEDRPGGKPQEANRRQTNVINQMFAPHTKGQWLWGRGLLEGEESPSVQIQEQLCGRHMRGHERIYCRSEQWRERTASHSSGYTFHFFTTWVALSHSDRVLGCREPNLRRLCWITQPPVHLCGEQAQEALFCCLSKPPTESLQKHQRQIETFFYYVSE